MNDRELNEKEFVYITLSTKEDLDKITRCDVTYIDAGYIVDKIRNRVSENPPVLIGNVRNTETENDSRERKSPEVALLYDLAVHPSEKDWVIGANAVFMDNDFKDAYLERGRSRMNCFYPPYACDDIEDLVITSWELII